MSISPLKKFLFLLILVLNISFALVLLYKDHSSPAGQLPANLKASYSEIKELENKNLSFKELSNFFTDLAEKKGASYAFEILGAAPIPPGTDMHLLGHVVGDILYKQEGAEGIKVCTQDFRNACSHSIVVGLLLEYGEGALPQITEACRRAPGGSGAYTMCFHGLGHGVLAYTGYDMEEAVKLCEKTGSDAFRQREYIECVGGTVMEIIGGGFHNPKLWALQSKKYLSKNDPLSLCSGDIIPDVAKPQCYTYLTPHLFVAAGANLARPGADNFKKAFPFCEKISGADLLQNRAACYGGFGKEFIVLVQERDIRKINEMTEDQLKKIYEWCGLAGNSEGALHCINSAMASLYWGGENNPEIAIRFCDLLLEKSFKESCFKNLVEGAYYYKGVGKLENFCGKLPAEYRGYCSREK